MTRRWPIALAGLALIGASRSAGAEDAPYVRDTDGRYRLEVRVPGTVTQVGASLSVTFCLSTAKDETLEACMGIEPVHSTWRGRNRDTTVLLIPGEDDARACTCARIVTLRQDSPECWRSFLTVPAIAWGTLDLGGFALILEEGGENGASPPRCVRVDSDLVRLSIEPAPPEEEPDRQLRWGRPTEASSTR